MSERVILSKLQTKKLLCVLMHITAKDAVTGKSNEITEPLDFRFFSYDGETFERLPSTKCDHDYTLGLANYRGLPLTTGSNANSNCYVKSEVYNFENNQWNDAPDYPFNA